MIWTRQAPFPSRTYRAVLQLSHALGENELPLALSLGGRSILSLACSSRGRWEGQQPGVPRAADPPWAGTEHTALGLQALNGVRVPLLQWWLCWWRREIAPGWVQKGASPQWCPRLPVKGPTHLCPQGLGSRHIPSWAAAAVTRDVLSYSPRVPRLWHHPRRGLPRDWIGQKSFH